MQSNAHKPPPPDDEDLQHLYEEVWRAFGDETPAEPSEPSPAGSGSVHSATRSYRDRDSPTYGPAGGGGGRYNKAMPDPTAQQNSISPTSHRRPRPLPPPPPQQGPASSGSGAHSHSASLPEDPQARASNEREGRPPGSASSSRPNTAGATGWDGRRQLPFAPGYHTTRPSDPNATSPVSPYGQQRAPGGGPPPSILAPPPPPPPDIYKATPPPPPPPPPHLAGLPPNGTSNGMNGGEYGNGNGYGGAALTAPSIQMPSPHVPGLPRSHNASPAPPGMGGSANGAGAGVGRAGSFRPPGAGAPVTPGLGGYGADGGYGNGNGNGSANAHVNVNANVNAREEEYAYGRSWGYSGPPPATEGRYDDGRAGRYGHAGSGVNRSGGFYDEVLEEYAGGGGGQPRQEMDAGPVVGYGAGGLPPELTRGASAVSTLSATSATTSGSSSLYPAAVGRGDQTSLFTAQTTPSPSVHIDKDGRGAYETYSGTSSGIGTPTERGQGEEDYLTAGAAYARHAQASAASSQVPIAPPHGHGQAPAQGQAQGQGQGQGQVYDEAYDEDGYTFDSASEDADPDRFVNFSLLSHLAVRLRDKVPRGTHVKSSIPYPRAFTGKDIVSTIQSQIQRELLINHGISTTDRRAALQVARSLQRQLFFYEVEWGDKPLQDGVEDVYMFLDDHDAEGAVSPGFERFNDFGGSGGGGSGGEAGPSSAAAAGRTPGGKEVEELPTAVITMLTRCYSTNCSDDAPCYSYACPRKRQNQAAQLFEPVAVEPEPVHQAPAGDWQLMVDPSILKTLPESEVHRQTIIHKTISQEEQYIQDLDMVEELFIRPLRQVDPQILEPSARDDFIEEVFGNILDLRECNKQLLESMYVRQREQGSIVQKIGDVFLEAATVFRYAYPTYVGHLPLAEKRFRDETESNAGLRLFLEDCARQGARAQEGARRGLDLKHFLSRPSEHLQKYPIALEAIVKETTEGNPDAEFLGEAIKAMRNLHAVAQLRTFQTAMGRGPAGKWEWFDLVGQDVREGLPKKEQKRQAIIFELIKGEMAYVKDLENIETMYVVPLREADPPIVPRDRLQSFITDVFHNFAELHAHHHRLLEQLHDIQREEHPVINSVTAPLLDTVLNFQDAYREYVPNYPIAAYRIDDEMGNNQDFKMFVEHCTRHPDAHRLDMKNFINRPIPRLLRYELLLKNVLDETPAHHEDHEAIPHVLELIKALGKETEPGVQSAKQKVELWRYNSNLVFKAGDAVDMDLLNENRSLIHCGKLYRQPDTGFEWNGWTELFVLLFDNYLVMTKVKEKDGLQKFNVSRRPIPLDLLTLASFTDPPTQRGGGLIRLGGLRDRHGGPSVGGGNPNDVSPVGGNMPESSTSDSRAVYPCTIYYTGRLGGLVTLYAESAQARAEWKGKLEEALGLRKVVQESNKVFEMEALSTDTFLMPTVSTGSSNIGSQQPAWNENAITGKVTCSVPFMTSDGRSLVAIGCAEGVWIGFRHDSRSMRRVLHLKLVTQCAMLEEFGIFLVLADKCLFAYHIEALVPSPSSNPHATQQTPQRVNTTRDVQFFSVGHQNGRTLVIYMKKKQLESIFRVLEPVVERINDRSRANASFTSRFGLRQPRSEWFRVFREFFLPSESYDLVFLKHKIAILCTKGFEIMDLTDFKSVSIPTRDDRYEKLAKRCENCRPMGMFRVDNEFLLVYDEFGVYVDRHGAPSRANHTIEWEGTAERAALHWPYILLFDSRFVEVRHITTGLLAQILQGTEIRCVWDGRGTSVNLNKESETSNEGMNLEPHIHIVMNNLEPAQGNRPRTTSQHIYELTPTVPLYLPGSLDSPTQSNFNQTNSPPRSPPLNPNWRELR
ncbi:hypothetical protein CONPUDRAFT_85508 [Coniophora puteana RWD-64-598 SS2]|uniref:Dbl homology domain-containing protein n=1 Tax=Coniophora puteana (strain RWD-64-598) TaxID=741705 RepID=A0A5M3M8I6_CONPW|nr:uncharacterized protein CONPUDRAFT_85508 [Coniophora puteana RWD-64-598 SS2]EIW75246.1 hypothetical protein CONPUDRAFT_85508 [Coniophora puteana RWD-64-598 SS2]